MQHYLLNQDLRDFHEELLVMASGNILTRNVFNMLLSSKCAQLILLRQWARSAIWSLCTPWASERCPRSSRDLWPVKCRVGKGTLDSSD
jgi:hypothetical protein